MRSLVILIVVLCSILFTLNSCSRGEGGKKIITVKGSDTMVQMGMIWAERYNKKNKDVSVQVTGGGSGTGIAALKNGTTDICESSRPIKEKEKKEIKEKFGKDVNEYIVAYDALAIYVHKDNPLNEISIKDLNQIYRNKITSWKELGGFDEEIVLYGRENNSGTYEFFKEHVLKGADFASVVQALVGTASIVNAISNDKRGIGYGGIGYATGIKLLKVINEETGKAVEPTKENVYSGEYPLKRPLFFYTVGELSQEVDGFIKWVLSEEGQAVCEEVGFFPVPNSRHSVNLQKKETLC